MAWYKNAQGQPVWVADTPTATPVGPRNPRLPAQVQGDILGNANTAATTGRTRVQTQGDMIDNRTKAATQAAMIAKARAEAIAAENAARGLTPEIMQQNKQRAASLSVIDDTLNQMQRQYEQNFRGNGGVSGRGRLSEIIPAKIPFTDITINSPNARFNNLGSRAGALFKPLIAPGAKDADAASEYEKKVMPFLPSAGNSDAEIEDKIRQLRLLRNQLAGIEVAPKKQQPAAPVIDFNHWGQ